jgi:hypothetical protein
MRIYEENPKHSSGGGIRGVKDTKMELRPEEAQKLLNDTRRCIAVSGKKQLIAIGYRKFYVFQPHSPGKYHGYPIAGKAICRYYPSAAEQIALLLGVDHKRLSRMSETHKPF